MALPLLPFQTDAVDRMVHFLKTNPEHGTYNACEPGLGKTLQAIETCRRMQFRRILVVSPAVVRLVWRDELQKWWPQAESRVITQKQKVTLKPKDGFTIVGYPICREKNIAGILSHAKYDCLILDEAHNVKSTRAHQSIGVLRIIWPNIPYRIALSGTPFTQSIMDAYTLFSRLNPTAFPDYFAFARRYANAQETPWGIKYHGLKNASELRKIIRDTFFIRYEKADVLKDLPPKIHQRIALPSTYAVTQSANEQRLYNDYIQQLRRALASGTYIPQPPTHVATTRRLQGLKKLPAIQEFIKNFVDTGIPLVVFLSHVEIIKKLETAFASINPAVIYGETSAEGRHSAIARFQSGETSLFIGQINAAGTGITLHRASHVLFGEGDWSPSVMSQATDRVSRIGQRQTVNVYHMVVEGSIDEDIEKILAEKEKTFAEALSDE